MILACLILAKARHFAKISSRQNYPLYGIVKITKSQTRISFRGARLTFWQQVKMALLARRSFCVVTGGSRGLGREISLRLSQGWSTAGVAADLVVLSRDRDAMLETKRMIEKSAPGVAVHVIQADLGEIKSLDEINAKVWSLHDASRHEQAILVLNAGTIGNLSQPISQQTCPEADSKPHGCQLHFKLVSLCKFSF